MSCRGGLEPLHTTYITTTDAETATLLFSSFQIE